MDPNIPWEDQERISHTDITPEVIDKYEGFFSKPSKSSAEGCKRLACDYLNTLIENRPKDATFSPPYVRFLSPMVRYSKMPFRMLCRRYGADLAFTPMILAKDVNRNGYITDRTLPDTTSYNEWEHASAFVQQYSMTNIDVTKDTHQVLKLKQPQDNYLALDEFTTCPQDRPLIAQLAVNDGIEASKCAEIFNPYVDGFDLNCGCPQSWVLREGIGAALSSRPELVEDIVKQVRQVSHGTTSIKIRLVYNLQQTVELMRRAEKMGIDWITVHGRTKEEKTQTSVRSDAISFLNRVVNCSVIYNGDVTTPQGMQDAVTRTGADGVLIARGALANPAIFCGQDQTPIQCVAEYLALAAQYGGLFPIHLHHISYMMYDLLNKGDRGVFTKLKSLPDIMEYLNTFFNIDMNLPSLISQNIQDYYSPLYSTSMQYRSQYIASTCPTYDIPIYSQLPSTLLTQSQDNIVLHTNSKFHNIPNTFTF